MKRILSFIIGITFIFANSKEGDIGFRYGFLSKPSYDSDSLIVLSDSSIIHTGDFLKINIGYKNKTNFCIAYRDADGGYMSLYSSDDKKDSNQDTLYASALQWNEMNKPTGLETFYFINSNESLSDLNIMLGRYYQAPPKGKTKPTFALHIEMLEADICRSILQMMRKIQIRIHFMFIHCNGLK